MLDQFSRTEMIIGKSGIETLQNAKIAVFGLGGVGSFAVEALARVGIGNFILVDNDVVDITNINRQIIATHSTVGEYKVNVMKERILDINPNAKIETYKLFYMPECKENILNQSVDYVLDCIDTVTAKIELIVNCNKLNIPIISAMGTGNKLNPQMFEITDIYKTSVCPLAKVMRKELKNRDIKHLKVLYSKEEPVRFKEKNRTPGSISFVPSVAGLMMAGEVIKDII